LWTTSYPYAEYVKHAWAGAWVCSLFRRRDCSPYVASELITQAVAATRWAFGDPPPLGMVTFIDPSEVPGFFRRTPEGRVLEWGYSYLKAGFEQAGWTKGGLVALRMKAESVPDAVPPTGAQLQLVI
ncbi:MAG: hypothetical protein HOQ26_18960, partial [Gemmatimonadaceae bacterium]|nr:hypothetical protein [Gemmatimonadaceae bacterium]